MNQATDRIVAWTEQGPSTDNGPLWEATVERCPADAPWTLYLAFQGAHDGDLDLNELQRCLYAARAAERELQRLTSPMQWARGEAARANPDIACSPKRVAAFVDEHVVRCTTRGCSLYGLFHLAGGDGSVRHLAMHAVGRGWELEVAMLPGSERWALVTRGDRVVSDADPDDFATAYRGAAERARRLNGAIGGVQ